MKWRRWASRLVLTGCNGLLVVGVGICAAKAVHIHIPVAIWLGISILLVVLSFLGLFFEAVGERKAFRLPEMH